MIENKKRRLQNHDYSSSGLYFVTICTRKRENYLADVVNDIIEYSSIGEVVVINWKDIPMHFSNVKLHEFIVMPNHFHGIIEILGTVDSRHVVNLQKFGPLIPGSLSVIVGQFKASVTRYCNKNGMKYFAWQPRFYDHIIRDKEEYLQITRYIKNNPKNWCGDQLYR